MSWSTISEIQEDLVQYDKKNKMQGSGPILYSDGFRTFIDNSEDHIEICGRTGEGKTEGVLLSAVRMAIEKRESLIVTDPKGDIYSRCGAVSKEYRKVVLNFRCPSQSPDCWNPLTMITRLSRSSDIQDRDLGAEMLSAVCETIFPLPKDDPFWCLSSRQFLSGVIEALNIVADSKEEINLISAAHIMEMAESVMGANIASNRYINILQSSLPKTSFGYRKLAQYTGSPNETRTSIFSVSNQGMEIFSRSEGLGLMLSEDTVNFMDWDLERRPFAVFIILPDENNVYSKIAAIFIDQLSQWLIKRAYDLGGRLPIKTNIVLEELGSLSSALPNLPNLAAAGRSRGIRLYMVLQHHAQLREIYGNDNAETICGSCGISINFSTNDFQTLQMLSARCGMTESVDNHGRPIQKALLPPDVIQKLPRFHALIFHRHIKFVTRLPMYNEIFDVLPAPKAREEHPERKTKIFDFIKFVQEQKERNMQKISELLEAIDKEEKEKEKKEKENEKASVSEKGMRKKTVKKNTGSNSHIMLTNTKTLCVKKYPLYVTANVRSRENVAKLIAEKKKISKRKAAIKIYDHQPVKLSFDNEMERFLFSKLVLLAGGNCTNNE